MPDKARDARRRRFSKTFQHYCQAGLWRVMESIRPQWTSRMPSGTERSSAQFRSSA